MVAYFNKGEYAEEISDFIFYRGTEIGTDYYEKILVPVPTTEILVPWQA